MLYAVQGQDRAKPAVIGPGQRRADLAASFQAAVVDVLAAKAARAAQQFGATRLA